MKQIVSEIKTAINNAKSTDEVENAKQQGTARIEAQQEAEKPTEPTGSSGSSLFWQPVSVNMLKQRQITSNIASLLFMARSPL